ncbi:SpaA isopeptide-forming pilin-related protein [uncultured Ruminococcus sp.]|uniref:prealbumin-like fold domain-containing protein n=1 Tax=Ruminococcus sp. JE7B6 TaxID=3233380 RepID=UPI0037DDCF50
MTASSPITRLKRAAYIDVYNKPYTLAAIKVDSVTDEPLSGAHFALYRSVAGIDGEVKDLYPIPGCEDLVSGSDGVIPKIDNTLAPGKYYLTEISPPANHDAHEEDIIFTIAANGVVSVDSVGDSEYLTVKGTTECNYIIKVPNELNLPIGLTITKTVTGSFGDKTKDFTFTLDVKDADPEDEYSWSKNGVPQAEPLCDNSTFTLRHGDSVKIMLPVNSTVTITEISQNYSTSFKLNDTAVTVGNTKTFLLAEESIIAVTNNLDAIIPTGVFHTAVGMAVFILTAFCLLAFPVILRRIHKNKGLTA